VQYRRWIFAGSLILLAATIFGMVRIRVSTGFASNFIRGSEVRSVFEKVNDQLGGVSSFFLVVDGGQDDAFTQPENLEVLRELQEWLKAQPEIGGATSIADGVMLLNRAFLGGEETALTIPTSARVVKQLLSFGGKDLTRGFADSKYRTANVVVRSRVSESGDVKKLMERLDRRLAELPQRLRARPTGDLVLLSSSMDAIVLSDLQSIGTAMFTIYLALAFLLTSFRVGLLALLPNLLPIAIYYGALGLTGTPLNLSTSLIAAITLGIAVDDTVHYFARFSLEARRLGDERRATATTLRSVIRPITFTMLGLCLGFLTLTMSELQNQVQFGLLSAFTIFVGWLLELTLSPAICSQLRLVTIWDLLSIDIGPQPQRSIPLFGGLSERQARVFALMSQIVSFPAGQRVFTEGERGDQMLVVIDGELSASLMRGTERVEYSRMRRGDTVGEIALFSERRSADVDVVKQARVLRFGEADLARLGKRYPRIAAKVNANLNRILANRVMSTTRALR
jgi:predicted RND superfamily exporter protein